MTNTMPSKKQNERDSVVIELAVKILHQLRDNTKCSEDVKNALSRAANSIELSVGDWE
jgi:hypothetical protein